jgi:hypothetical protein
MRVLNNAGSLRIAAPGGSRRSAWSSRVTFLVMDVYNEQFVKNPFRLAKATCSPLPKP